MLNMDNPASSSPFQVLFSRLFVFKVNVVSNLKARWHVVCCLLCIFESVLFSMLSWLWQVHGSAFPNLVIQNPGHQEIAAGVLTVGVGEDWGLFHR